MFKKPKAPVNVESITAKLHNTVAELESHAEDQAYRAAVQAGAAAEALAASDAHKAEHERAKVVAGNIKSLLGA